MTGWALIVVVFFVLSAFIAPTVALGEPPSSLLEVDLSSEFQMGPTNINGVLGNGRLTAGISLWGEITVLHWPSPSYYDHIQYTTKNGFPFSDTLDVRMKPDVGGSYGANLRAIALSDNMGSFGGIFLKTQSEPEGRMAFFRDNDWTPSQRYLSSGIPVLLSQYRNDALQAGVSVEDLIVPGADVLIRNFSISLDDGSPVTEWKYAYYANLSPSHAKPDWFPVVELFETLHDFAAIYLPQEEILVQFLPDDVAGAASKLPLLASMTSTPEIDDAFGKGIYIVMGFDFTPDGFQVGADSFTACSKNLPADLASAGQDAYADLADGRLDNNPLTACQANFAVLKNASGQTATFRVLFSLADTALEAEEKMLLYKTMDAEAVRDEVTSDWQAFLDRRTVRLDQPVLDDFIKNTLMTIRIAKDAATDAVVASIATQPAYNFDWPRDGSFINLFLDIMGYSREVENHDLFYAKVQRKHPVFPGLTGSWNTYYWADGEIGTFFPPFEIDETALALWTLVKHTNFIADPEDQRQYLQKVFPAVELAADLLTRCKDATTNMQCPANEDDNFTATMTLHGATAVYAGLVSAAKAARFLGETQASQWEERAAELKDAMLSYYDEEKGYFTNAGWRGGEWLIYPAEVLPIDDPRIKSQAEHIREADVLPEVNLETEGFAYLSEKIFALALAYRNDPQHLDEAKGWLDYFVRNVPTKDTGHLGEVALIGDFDLDGTKEFVNVTSIPHVWEATVLSLALLAAYHPVSFDADQPYPLGSDDDSVEPDDDSGEDAASPFTTDRDQPACGCSG